MAWLSGPTGGKLGAQGRLQQQFSALPTKHVAEVRIRYSAWHRAADLPGASGRRTVPGHCGDEQAELPGPVLLVPVAGATGRVVLYCAAGLGNRSCEVGAVGEGETGAASAAQLLLPAKVVRRPNSGPEPRYPGTALRLGLSDTLVQTARRQARPRRRDLHGIVHLARPGSEEHTSELQSLRHLVCRLLLV